MARYDFDLFTIGAGSGGVRASRMSARYGARVAVAEERDLGGTCVNVGCIPKKLLVYASAFRRDVEDAAGFGWTPPPPIARLARADPQQGPRDRALERRLRAAARRCRRARGSQGARGSSTRTPSRWAARRSAPSTSSWRPAAGRRCPRFPGIEHAITSNEAFHLDALPERPIVVGGGYIAVEFAGILHGLGARVTQLYRGPLFLRGFDDDVRAHLAARDAPAGDRPALRFGHRADREGVGRRAARDARGRLAARGRRDPVRDGPPSAHARPRARGGEGRAARERRDPRRRVLALARCRASTRSATSPTASTSRRSRSTRACASPRRCSADGRRWPEHANVPSAVFSQPAIGAVGCTEAEARERYGEVDVYRTTFRELKHTLSGRERAHADEAGRGRRERSRGGRAHGGRPRGRDHPGASRSRSSAARPRRSSTRRSGSIPPRRRSS